MKRKMKNEIIKKIFMVTATILCVTSITGCDSINKVIEDNAVIINPEIPEPTVGEKTDEKIYIWTDKDTGVQYVIYREKTGYAGFGGITPRLNSDGSICVTEESETAK